MVVWYDSTGLLVDFIDLQEYTLFKDIKQDSRVSIVVVHHFLNQFQCFAETLE